MGCAESKEQELSNSQPLLSTFPAEELTNTSFVLNMGQPQLSQPFQAGPSPLSSQHERLLLELLPFKDRAQFHE